MKYFEYLESNKENFVEQLKHLFAVYKVQPVGSGYIDCIVMRDKLAQIIGEISHLGILLIDVSWWCYVDPTDKSSGCPHGMGGPNSEYYEGWFSELQNDMYTVANGKVDSLMDYYDKESVIRLNMQTLEAVQNILKTPFRYTPTEYIQENKCVMPALWLLVPDDWKRY